jgi:DNA excision repair protein ERCC-1
VVLVSRSQNGNPLLRHVRCVRWAFADVLPDFVLGDNACAVFVSLRYHLLHPKYLATKIASLQRAFRLRAVLCLVDTEDVVKPLGEVNKIAAMGDCVLLCAFSPEEAARYVETLKAYEKKSPDAIKERRDADYVSRLAGALTAIRGVNKVDASSLGAQFGSLAGVMRADKATLAATPGLGPTKTKRLNEALHAPFKTQKPARRTTVSRGGARDGRVTRSWRPQKRERVFVALDVRFAFSACSLRSIASVASALLRAT